MNYNLTDRAKELHKDNEHLQSKWISAVNYLRTQSERWWILDSQGVNINDLHNRSQNAI